MLLQAIDSRLLSDCNAGLVKLATVGVRDAEEVGRDVTIGQTTATRWRRRRIPAKAVSRNSVIVMCREVEAATSNTKVYILERISMTIGVRV